MDLAVVYPVYNEVDLIRETAEETAEFLRASGFGDWKIVFVTDNCTDGTEELAEKLDEELEEVIHLGFSERLGKGLAFEKAFYSLDAEKFIYSDVDLSTDLKHIEDAVDHIGNGNDIAVGSRRKDNSIKRNFTREIPSIAFNELLRFGLGSKIKDHQCGFKAFDYEAVKDIIDDVESEHWFWDAEMLVKAQKEGKEIKEFSVEWKDNENSKVSVLTDSIYFLRKTAELRIKLWL